MSREARVRKMRRCRNCGTDIYGDAAKLREHQGFHSFVNRTGLVLPRNEIQLRGGIIKPNSQEARHGN